MLMKDNNAVFHQALPTTSQFLAQDGDRLKLQLSSAVTMSSDRACSTSADDPATNHDYMTVLSLKGILPCLFNKPFCLNLHWVLLMEISVSILFLAILMISGHCCFSVVGITASGHQGAPRCFKAQQEESQKCSSYRIALPNIDRICI
uniref:Uncharacterized protein n=1 Tax=Zea mays TaxID=4577 RepID=A0A804NRL2_MAIZE